MKNKCTLHLLDIQYVQRFLISSLRHLTSFPIRTIGIKVVKETEHELNLLLMSKVSSAVSSHRL